MNLAEICLESIEMDKNIYLTTGNQREMTTLNKVP